MRDSPIQDDPLSKLTYSVTMQPAIAFTERRTEGIVIAFVDGKAGLFTASLLYDTLPLARSLTAATGRAEAFDQDSELP